MELQRAKAIAEDLKQRLEPACSRIAIAGSIRRQKPEVRDIELLCIPKIGNGTDCLDQAIKLFMQFGVLSMRLNKRGSRTYGPKNKLMVHVPSGMAIDLFSSTEENWGMALFVRTGPREWNIKAMSRFSQLGMQGHAYGGVTDAEGAELGCPDEEAVFRYLGWAYVTPERRAWLWESIFPVFVRFVGGQQVEKDISNARLAIQERGCLLKINSG